MPVAAPSEGYLKMIAYGRKKAALRWDQLTLQAIMAGVWVAIYGHCCTYFAGQFYVKDVKWSPAITKGVYGFLFPGAFIAVIYTGTELFTGNTVTMIMLVFNDGVKALKDLARVWLVSFLGNLTGAVFGAFFFTYLSGAFKPQKGMTHDFLQELARGKVDHEFGEALILGVGCNALVCLCTWCVVVSDDGAGKILAIFYCIGVFAMGGFEHIVANFYTLTAALFCTNVTYNILEAIYKNWIPVAIGNIIAGSVLTGTLWWYALHPQYTELAAFTNQELARELTQRVNNTSAPAGGAQDTKELDPFLRWRPEHSKSHLLTAHRLVPNVPAQSPAKDYSIVFIQNKQDPAAPLTLGGSVPREPEEVVADSEVEVQSMQTAQPASSEKQIYDA